MSGLADSVSLPARLGRDLHELKSYIPTSIRKRLGQTFFSLEVGFRKEQERTVLPVDVCRFRFQWTSLKLNFFCFLVLFGFVAFVVVVFWCFF